MLIESGGKRLRIHADAWIAPDAVVSGAVVTADGGPVRIGRACIVMENAVAARTRPPGYDLRYKPGVIIAMAEA